MATSKKKEGRQGRRWGIKEGVNEQESRGLTKGNEGCQGLMVT